MGLNKTRKHPQTHLAWRVDRSVRAKEFRECAFFRLWLVGNSPNLFARIDERAGAPSPRKLIHTPYPMFRIDSVTNRITKLKQVKFSSLGYGERTHLQEWLANEPEALGEPLLIIQKEFAGFDETKERLDLLALDKDGRLVVIENKLDDSGRDVVWQCLKYASYCSTLSKSSIENIYQAFLDKVGKGENARKRICEFLGSEEFEEVVLNGGNSQRLVMVAAQFRKEVTSTVLWLMKHNVNVECFKATPYQHEQEVFLNLEQIIPLPEAEELMIGIAEKEQEEHAAEKHHATRFAIRLAFWQRVLEALENADVRLYENVNPSRDSWLNAGCGIGGVHYTMILNQDMVRVSIEFAQGAKEKNKAMFDYLYGRRGEIESAFGHELEWRRLEDNKVSIICFCRECEGHNRDKWPETVEWMVTNIQKVEQVMSPHLPALKHLLKIKFPK